MASKKSRIENFTHWLLIIPVAIGSLGFIISGLLIIPNEWTNYKAYKKKIDKIEIKMYGASPDDFDGMRASIEKDIEHDKIIKDAKELIPITRKLFTTDLPALKHRVSDNEKYIEKIKKTLGK